MELDTKGYNKLEKSIALAQHTVYKRYLTELSQYPVVSATQVLLNENAENCLRFFQLKELTYKKGEDIFQKLSSIYHACMAWQCSLIVMVDVKKINAPANIYIGVRNNGENTPLTASFETLKSGIKSNFPGTKWDDIGAQTDLPKLIDDIFSNLIKCISSVSCIASARDKSKTTNKEFIQGLERFIDAMHGNTYTAIFIAEPIGISEQATIRRGYEDLYTTLYPFHKNVWSYNQNESNSVMESITEGISESITEGTNKTIARTKNMGFNIGINSSQNNNMTTEEGKNSATTMSKVGSALTNVAGLVGAITENPIAGAAGAAGVAVGILGGLMQGDSTTTSIANSIGKAMGINAGFNANGASTKSFAKTNSTTNTTTTNTTKGTTTTTGNGKTLQIENINKSIEEMLKCIEEQLKRVQESEDYGAYNCGAYFLAAEQNSCLLAANTYHALMIGEGTSVESGSVNAWFELDKVNAIKEYLKRFVHPVFAMPISKEINDSSDVIMYTPSTIVSGLELPLHLGLPIKSVYGLPVVEHAEFGRNVVNHQSER